MISAQFNPISSLIVGDLEPMIRHLSQRMKDFSTYTVQNNIYSEEPLRLTVVDTLLATIDEPKGTLLESLLRFTSAYEEFVDVLNEWNDLMMNAITQYGVLDGHAVKYFQQELNELNSYDY